MHTYRDICMNLHMHKHIPRTLFPFFHCHADIDTHALPAMCISCVHGWYWYIVCRWVLIPSVDRIIVLHKLHGFTLSLQPFLSIHVFCYKISIVHIWCSGTLCTFRSSWSICFSHVHFLPEHFKRYTVSWWEPFRSIPFSLDLFLHSEFSYSQVCTKNRGE